MGGDLARATAEQQLGAAYFGMWAVSGAWYWRFQAEYAYRRARVLMGLAL